MQDFDSNMHCKAGDSDLNNTFPVGWTIHSQVTDLLVNGKTVPTNQDKAIWVQTHSGPVSNTDTSFAGKLSQ